MNRKRCTSSWLGPCADTDDMHACARPPGHLLPCMCYCGDRAHVLAAASPASDGQQPLWDGAA